MGLNGTHTIAVSVCALLALAGCQGPQVYNAGNIGAAPFLSNVAPIAYSRVEPAPAPAYTIDSVAIDTVPQPTYILDSSAESVRMAEPVVEAEFISDPVAVPLEYAAPAAIPEPIVYSEVAPQPSFPTVAQPSYVIESEAPAFEAPVFEAPVFDGTTYLEAPVTAPEPIYATEAVDLPTPPAGIEVEIIPPQPIPAAPLVNQPGLAGYGEAF